MPASFLFAALNGVAGSVTAYRYEGASPAQVGDPYGTQWTAVTAQTALNNGVVQYKGQLYGLAQDGVYKKDDPTINTGPWTQVIAFTNPTTSKPRTSGLVIVHIADVPTLVVVFGDLAADNSWRWANYDGTTWTQAASPDVSTSMGEMHAVSVYRNVIHMIGSAGTDNTAMTFDPSSDTFGIIPEVFGASQYAHCMCVFNDRLFGIHNVSNVCRLVEFSGGSWIDVPGGVGITINGGNYLGKWGIWTDGTYLYGMIPSVGAFGWRVLQWDNTLGAPTNITAAVLPAALKSTTDGGTYGGGSILSGSVFACLDQDTDPAIADVWLFQATNVTAGTIFTLWKWNGPAALVTQEDVGGDVTHAIPVGMIQSGERIWTAGELDITLTGKTAVVGGERLKWRGYGAAGAADKKVKFFFNKEGEPALLQCTLTAVAVLSGAPAGAPSVAANEVTNVDADPTVEYAATWNIGTDGVLAGDRVQVKAQLSI